MVRNFCSPSGSVLTEVGLPHRALELREQERQRLLVVPDVRAVHRAAAGVVVAALEGVEPAVRGPQAGRRADDGHLARDRVEHLGRQRGVEERVVERPRPGRQVRQPLERFLGGGPGVRPLGGEPVGHAAADDGLAGERLERAPVVHQVREVPGEDERQLDGLAGREPDPEPERARVGLAGGAHRALGSLGQAAVGAEIVPEVLDVVEPPAPLPVLGEGDVAPRRRHRDRAGAGMSRVEAGPAHPDPADRALVRPLVQVAAEHRVPASTGQVRDAVEAHRIHLGVGEGELDRAARGIPEPPEEDGDRQARDPIVERDERRERLQLRLDREGRILEADRGGRVRAGERRLLEPRQRRDGPGGQTPIGHERRQEAPLQDPGDGLAALGARPDREEAERQIAPLRRAVEDLPVAQLTAAAERDRPGADAAEREADLLERRAGEAPAMRGGSGARAARRARGGRVRDVVAVVMRSPSVRSSRPARRPPRSPRGAGEAGRRSSASGARRGWRGRRDGQAARRCGPRPRRRAR